MTKWRTFGTLGMLALAASGCVQMKELQKQNAKLAKLNTNQQKVIQQQKRELDMQKSNTTGLAKSLADERRLSAALDKRLKQQEDEVRRVASELDSVTHRGEKEKQRIEGEIDRLTRSLKGVSWKKTEEGPVVALDNKDLFNSGQSVLKTGSSETLKKVAALLCYKSQQHRNYAREDYVRNLAFTRAIDVGRDLAEVFELYRWVM